MYQTSFHQTCTQLQALWLKSSVWIDQGWSRYKNKFYARTGQLNQIPIPLLRMAGFFGSDNDLSHVHQLQQMLQQQIRLREAIQRIRRVLDAQNVYRVAVQELLDFFKADWVFILGHGLNLWRSSDQLRHSGNVDNSATLNAYCELENAAAKLGKPLPIVVNEQSLQQFPVGQKWLNQYPGSWLLIPIPLFPGHQLQTDKTEKPWGLVAIGSKDGKNRWSSTQQEQVKLLVDEVAIALNHSLKYQQLKQDKLELRELALTDSLTGLANRRQFDDYFKAEWQRLAREQQPLTLILCDIDYFKLYNDYYGHPTGDICLAKVSDVLNRCIRRPADLVARYGGEEFAVVLPNTNTEGGHSVALAIQKQLAQVAIPHFTSSVSKAVTLTMGIATVVPEHQRTSQDLLQAADLALYHAKQQGRDRIYVHAHYCVQSHNCSGSLAQVANPDLSQPNN